MEDRWVDEGRALSLASLCCVAALGLFAGCGPSWIVKEDSGDPSALRGVRALVVEFDYDGMLVGPPDKETPEQHWVAQRTASDPDYRKTWTELKSTWESSVLEAIGKSSRVMVRRASPGVPVRHYAAVLTVRLERLEIGRYIPLVPKWSKVQVAQRWERQGTFVAEIETRSAVEPTVMKPSIFQHIASMGEGTGMNSALFLLSRMNGAPAE